MATTQIALRLDDDELAALDAEVVAGRSANRSEAVRREIGRLQREQRANADEQRILEIVRSGETLYPDLDEWRSTSHPTLD